MSNWGILLAAGLGTRIGMPKALLLLDGKPILWHSLHAFESSPSIDRIGIVCRKEDLEEVNSLVRTHSIKKIGFMIPGGRERQDSVFEGISALPENAELVSIHDAARPLVTDKLIEAVLAAAKQIQAALIAVPTKDTIKITRNHQVRETLNRDQLWCAQTPQAFRVELFKRAIKKAKADGFYATDCATLVERLGVPVHLVEGLPENIKVTTQSDLVIAEALLKQRLHA